MTNTWKVMRSCAWSLSSSDPSLKYFASPGIPTLSLCQEFLGVKALNSQIIDVANKLLTLLTAKLQKKKPCQSLIVSQSLVGIKEAQMNTWALPPKNLLRQELRELWKKLKAHPGGLPVKERVESVVDIADVVLDAAQQYPLSMNDVKASSQTHLFPTCGHSL